MADEEFKLNSQNHEFSDRVNSIFGSLTETKSLSAKSEASPGKPKQAQGRFPSYKRTGNEISRDHSYRPLDNRRFQNKRPSKPPDHVLRPEKYTKYSLKNDGTVKLSVGMSADALNKKIALDFINDIKQQKSKDGEITTSIEKSDDLKLHIKFSKRKPQAETAETNSSSLFQSSHGGKARVMGTFEFGQKQTNEKKEKMRKSTSNNVSSNIKLNYYDEEDEEEE